MKSPTIKVELNKEEAFAVLAFLSRLVHEKKLELHDDAEREALRALCESIDDELVETFRDDYKKFVEKSR